MVIEKIVLKVGKKRIELTQAEYEELKSHFRETQWVPYPVYPQPTYPTTPWITYSNGVATVEVQSFSEMPDLEFEVGHA